MISDGIQGYRMLFLHTALTLDTQCSDQEKVEPPEPDSCDEEAEVTTWDWIGLSLAIQFEIPISIGFPKGVSHFCLEYPWIFLSLWVEYQEDLGPESTDKTRRLSGTGTIPFPTGTPNLCFGLGRQFNQWCMIYIYDIYIWYNIYIHINVPRLSSDRNYWFWIGRFLGQVICISLVALASSVRIDGKGEGLRWHVVEGQSKYTKHMGKKTRKSVENVWKSLWKLMDIHGI
jgi:hypothetical protein